MSFSQDVSSFKQALKRSKLTVEDILSATRSSEPRSRSYNRVSRDDIVVVYYNEKGAPFAPTEKESGISEIAFVIKEEVGEFDGSYLDRLAVDLAEVLKAGTSPLFQLETKPVDIVVTPQIIPHLDKDGKVESYGTECFMPTSNGTYSLELTVSANKINIETYSSSAGHDKVDSAYSEPMNLFDFEVDYLTDTVVELSRQHSHMYDKSCGKSSKHSSRLPRDMKDFEGLVMNVGVISYNGDKRALKVEHYRPADGVVKVPERVYFELFPVSIEIDRVRNDVDMLHFTATKLLEQKYTKGK
jgi:hypothetical protein